MQLDFVWNLVLNSNKLICSYIVANNLTHRKNNPLLRIPTVIRLVAYQCIHQIFHVLICTLSSLTKSLPVELTQCCPRVLARQIYKTNNSISFSVFHTIM